MCELVGVSKSGYYNWLGRPEAATKVRRRKLALLVESEFKASDMILRVPAPRRRSEAQGHRRVPRHASAPLMREKGLKAAQPRRKVRTTIPADDIDTRPDLVDRDSRRRGPRAQMGRGHHLHPHVGRIRVSGHRSGLLHQESRRLRHGRQHEDRPDLQGHRYGRAPLPPPGGGHDLPLRPGQSVHLTAIRQTSEELQDPPLRRENRRVLGQCLGASPSTPP